MVLAAQLSPVLTSPSAVLGARGAVWDGQCLCVVVAEESSCGESRGGAASPQGCCSARSPLGKLGAGRCKGAVRAPLVGCCPGRGSLGQQCPRGRAGSVLQCSTLAALSCSKLCFWVSFLVGGKGGRRVELRGAVIVSFTPFSFNLSGSQVPGRDPSSMAASTESRQQPPATNCFGSRSR